MPAVQAAAEGSVLHVPRRGASWRACWRQTHCGEPGADATTGLVAYLDGEPVGWCAVEPRTAYPGLLRVYRVPWEGRAEDKTDESVWAVTCVFTRAGYRRRGISRALVRAAVEFARRPRRPGARRLPDARGTGSGHHLGRDARRQPQHLRRRRFRGGQPPDTASGGDANRLRLRSDRHGRRCHRGGDFGGPCIDVRPVPEVACGRTPFAMGNIRTKRSGNDRGGSAGSFCPGRPMVARADGCAGLLDRLAAPAARSGDRTEWIR